MEIALVLLLINESCERACCQKGLTQDSGAVIFSSNSSTPLRASYGNISLVHLADHLIYLFSSSSFWFGLNSSYDHDFHLSKQLGMAPKQGHGGVYLKKLYFSD